MQGLGFKLGVFTFLMGSLLLQSTAKASSLKSMCYAPSSNIDKIEGLNISTRLPIASVSKLLTSHWIVKSKGIDYRFRTVVYVTPVDDGFSDLHFQGSRDPYFGAEKIHYMISELNKRGIKKIRNMTFDENFKFFWFADDPESMRSIAVGFYVNSEPTKEKVISQLRARASMISGYEETLEKAKKLKLDMIEKPEFTVQNIDFLPTSQFFHTQATQVFSVASRDLKTVLKEMNRNSNNHAANQIFEHLGSTKSYRQFIKDSLGLLNEDVIMLNGSGDRVDTAQGARYNEASCEATLRIIVDLHLELQKSRSTFGQIATIVGTNPGSATSLYSNKSTNHSVIAKTGTVNPSVTLGGVASTQKGLVYFMFIVDPKGNFSSARNTIRTELGNLIEKNGGPKPVNGQSFSFFTADAQSFAETEKVISLK